MRNRLLIFLLCACLLTLSACGKAPSDELSGSFDPETIPTGSTPKAEIADTAEMDLDFTENERANTPTGTVVDLTAQGDTVTVTKAGVYRLSGTFTDTQVVVDAGEEKVWLLLDNVTLSNQKGAAIYVRAADKVFITLKEGTKNTVSDGDSYTQTDGDTTIDAAIFSRADLAVNGTGTLTVNGNYKHGIVSKDDLVITAASLQVTAENVGLNGKDCVKIYGGEHTVKAGSDGIRSDNAEDAARGYVYLENSVLTINADNDGIQAETLLKTENVILTVTSGGGSGYSLSTASESYKGLKAGSDLQLHGGTYTIFSRDDCLHSNHTVSISDGVFNLNSGDDGIHADTDLSVSGGEISVLQSYEGLEGSRILISGGRIQVKASDDGLNAAGGNDGSGAGERFGRGHFESSTGEIVISGGYTCINASGDGIDSNGDLTVTGGVTLVSGPTNNGNGVLDYGGTALVSGGIVLALGSSGMAQGFTKAENQGAILSTFTAQRADTSFAVCDSQGKAVVSFTPPKAYECAVITAPGIQKGESYTLVAGATVVGADENGYAQSAKISGGNTLETIEMSSDIYGTAGGFGGGMGGMGGMGGGRPGGGRPFM